MKAVVLAGGRGVRLKPLTDSVPKGLIPVAGKPLLERLLQQISGNGFTEALIVVSYMKEKIIEHFGKSFNGMSLKYAVQDKPLGTGHAALQAKSFAGKEQFFLCNGDLALGPNVLREFLDEPLAADESKIAAAAVKDPLRFGVFDISPQGYLIDWEEKPDKAKSNLINAGLYTLKPSIFAYLEKLSPSARGEHELTDGINAMLHAGEKFRVHKVRGYWNDIGNFEQLKDAEDHFKGVIVKTQR